MSDHARTPFEIEIFYDGGCPLCRREIALLRRWDRRQRMRFVDIDFPSFSAEAVGTTHARLMAELHGRLPDGTWVHGVEAFRRMYAAVGFGPLVWLSRLPPISWLLTAGYLLFARHRLRLTGRCTAAKCS